MDTYTDLSHYITAFGFALPRMLIAFSLIPLLSREALPLFLRVSVVSCFAMFLVPGLLGSLDNGMPPPIRLISLIAKEAVIGVFIGFALSIPLWAFEAMGDLVDTQRGASIAQTLNPMTGHESSPLGQFFSHAAVTLLFVIGGFTMMIAVLYDSYALWPVFSPWPTFDANTPLILLGLLDQFMLLTVLLSAPVVFVMFLAEAGLAIVSRFAPQLQVFFLAMPVKSGLAMLVFALYAGILFEHQGSILMDTFRNTLQLLANGLHRT